jgi:hypothetical protein
MELADREKDGRLIVRLVTMDPEDGNSTGRQTVYSVVISMKTFHETPVEMYLTSYVGVCGGNRAERCAQSILAAVDEQATELRKVIKDVLDKARK